MDAKVVPAVLAYKGGELFANIIRIVDEIPPGRNLSTESLELVLRRYVPFLSVRYKREQVTNIPPVPMCSLKKHKRTIKLLDESRFSLL